MLASSLSGLRNCEKRQRGDYHIEEDFGSETAKVDRWCLLTSSAVALSVRSFDLSGGTRSIEHHGT